MALPELASQSAIRVPDERRMDFLPRLFGRRLLIIGEHTVFRFMEILSPGDYGGGLWDFYERAGQPLYLAPTSKPRCRLFCEGNGFEGEVSSDAAGIIATLFAFSLGLFAVLGVQLFKGAPHALYMTVRRFFEDRKSVV